MASLAYSGPWQASSAEVPLNSNMMLRIAILPVMVLKILAVMTVVMWLLPPVISAPTGRSARVRNAQNLNSDG